MFTISATFNLIEYFALPLDHSFLGIIKINIALLIIKAIVFLALAIAIWFGFDWSRKGFIIASFLVLIWSLYLGLVWGVAVDLYASIGSLIALGVAVWYFNRENILVFFGIDDRFPKWNWIYTIVAIPLSICVVAFGVCVIPSLLTPIPAPPQEDEDPAWSPDGQQIAYACFLEGPTRSVSQLEIELNINQTGPDKPFSVYSPEAADICTINLNGGNPVRLTKEPVAERFPVWSPDHTKIAYLRFPDETAGRYQSRGELYVVDTATYETRQLAAPVPIPSHIDQNIISWSPDGQEILFSASIDFPDRDVYVVNVNDGTLKNLTPNSRKHEINPSWIFNGSKIFFLSIVEQDGPHQMKIIDADGTNEQEIIEDFYYSSVTVSNFGVIAFVSDMTSKTKDEFDDLYAAELYILQIGEEKPVKIPRNDTQRAPVVYSWSPDGKLLLYDDRREKILNIETGEVKDIPSMEPFRDNETDDTYQSGWSFNGARSWSPDSNQIALDTYLKKGGEFEGYIEDHIYILDLQKNTTRPLIQD